MPPQDNTNGQVPPAQNQSQQSGPSSAPHADFSVDSITKNKKLVETVKIFAIYGGALSVVNTLIGMIVYSIGFYSYYYTSFNILALVGVLIGGAIGSAIGGLIFYFIYEPIRNWIKRTPFLAKYIYSLFTAFWVPFLVGTIITAALGLLNMLGLGAMVGAYAAMGFGTLFIGWAIMLVAHVAVYYFYAKMISAKLGGLYSW